MIGVQTSERRKTLARGIDVPGPWQDDLGAYDPA